MDTEKYYYGLNLDLETTKKDSSNIDCELPGKLPENPSLNTTNTSLLNKGSVSLSSEYKKLVDCPKTFTLTKHNDAIADTSLQVIEQQLLQGNIRYNYTISTGTNIIIGTKKDVYLGYEDTDKIFTNKLGTIITTQVTTLDSDTAGCSAKAYLRPNDNTGAPIKFSLNKCIKDRTITFSYKNLPIFQIKQTYDKSSTTKSWTIYVCKLWSTSFTYANTFALFDTNNPMSISSITYGNQIKQFIGFHNNQTTYVIMYTPDKKIIMNYQGQTIGTLLKNGNLKHLSGHDYLTQNEYKDLYLDNINSVNHWEQSSLGQGTLSTKTVILDMNIYVYINERDVFTCTPANTFNFNNTEDYNHLGVYKLQATT